MCSKPTKAHVAGEESKPQSQLAYPKTRNRLFFDGQSLPATNEQGPPKRTKYHRNVNLSKAPLIKTRDSSSSQQAKEHSKFRYIPRAVSNETLNIPDFQLTTTGLSCEQSLQKGRFFRHIVDKASFPESSATAPPINGLINTNLTVNDGYPSRAQETPIEAGPPTALLAGQPSKLRYVPRVKAAKVLQASDSVQDVGRKRVFPHTLSSKTDNLPHEVAKESEAQASDQNLPAELSQTFAIANPNRISPPMLKENIPSTFVNQQDLDQAVTDEACSDVLNCTFVVVPDIAQEANVVYSDESYTRMGSCRSDEMHVEDLNLTEILANNDNVFGSPLQTYVEPCQLQANSALVYCTQEIPKKNERRDARSEKFRLLSDAEFNTLPPTSVLSPLTLSATTSGVDLPGKASKEACPNSAATFTDVPSKYQRPNVLGLIKNTSYPSVNEISSVASAHTLIAPNVPGESVWECPRGAPTRLDKAVTADDIGRRVLVGNEKAGVLKYFGSVTFESGIWCGVDLDEPEGKNDGTIKGKRYFTCVPYHGLLAPLDKVQILCDAKSSGYAFVASSDTSEQLKLFAKGVMAMDQVPPASTSTPTPSSTTSSQPCWDSVSGPTKPAQQLNSTFSKQNSFECDESLGILTPDQMLADFTFATPSEQTMDYVQHVDDSKRFLRLDVDNSQSCILNEELNYESICQSISMPSRTADEAVNASRGGVLDPAFESDASEDFISRALNLSKSDPKVQDASDRTLSPEDLPMDPPSPHQPLQLKESAAVLPNEETKVDVIVSGSPGPSSRSQPPPTSFITSITSIGSLDTDGYQGDGELSRPASRNTCSSPTAALMQKGCPSKMKTSTHDPMTDSDFFTESDADVHDDVGGGVRGGDRRAQVIDGTLYNNTAGNNGGVNQQHQRCPSFTASINEEMESSGVYSDLERKPDEFENSVAVKERKTDELENPLAESERKTDADCSPDGSTKTVSSKSDASQVKEIADLTILVQDRVDASQEATLIENNARNLLAKEVPQVHEAMEIVTTASTPDTTTRPATVPANAPAPLNDSKVAKKSLAMMKHPMPKRNVASKIKAMLEASPTNTRSGNASIEDVHQESLRRPSATKTPRPGRWDAVMSKIAQGQADEKLKPDRLKEVKSKVFAGIADGQPPVVGTPKRKLPAQSSSAKKENQTPLKAKSRRARSHRASSSSSVHQSTPGGGGDGKTPGRSACSSQRSSLSDVSLNTSAQPGLQGQQAQSSAQAAKATAAQHRSTKKHPRDAAFAVTRDATRSASPHSDASTASAASHHVTPTRAAPPPLLLQQPPPPPSSGHARTTPGRVVHQQPRGESTPKSVGGGGVVAKRHPPGAVVVTSNKRLHLSPPQPSPLHHGAQQEKNGAGVVADMKTPMARKPTSSRRNEKHKLQRDHNRLAGVNKPLGDSPVRSFAPSNDATSTPVSVRDLPPPPHTPPQVDLRQLEEAQQALQTAEQALQTAQQALQTAQSANKEIEAKHTRCVRGFDALTVVTNYIVNHYDAFSTPLLKKQLASTRAAKNDATLALDEMSANLRRLEDDCKRAAHEHRAQLEAAHETRRLEIEQMREASCAEVEAVREACRAEVEALKEKHEMELVEVTRQQQAIQMANLAEIQQKNKEANIQHETELRQRQVESRKLELAAHGEDRMQVPTRQWRMLQDELSSLRTVLELRHGELQELRLKNSMLERDKDELETSQKKASTYRARVEDLELQLKLKKDEERRFSTENKSLVESLHNESLSNKRLQQVNEELSWKLDNKVKAFNILAHNATLVPVSDYKYTSPSASDTTTQSLPDFALGDIYEPSHSKNAVVTNKIDISMNTTLTTTYLERSDSVAWIFDMEDEAPDDAAQKTSLRKSASFKKVNSTRSNSTSSSVSSQSSPRNKPKHHSYVTSPDQEFNKTAWEPSCCSTPNKLADDSTFINSPENGIEVDLESSSETDALAFSLMSNLKSGKFAIPSEPAPVDIEMETEALVPLVPLSGSKSSELAFMAAKIPPVPKDAGGEAMISEETSEEDNSVDQQSSDDESSSEIQ